MAAKLEWKGPVLWVGPFIVGEVFGITGVKSVHRYAAGNRQSGPCESIVACMQDCESEVRRLLKEAGVDCE